MRLLGAILAGGASRRFGSDKAEALLDGKRLLDHVAEALAAQTDAVILCGREDDRFRCVADRPETRIGPLGGLAAALHFASEQGFDAVLTAGCDSPDLGHDVVVSLRGEGAAIAESQPVIGYWPVRLAPELDAFIANGGRSLFGFAEAAGARRVTLAVPPANINAPEDLDRLSGKRP